MNEVKMGKIKAEEFALYQKYKEEVENYFAGAGCFSEKYRLKYHLSPPVGWLNDPNGLIYKAGIYHIYYQYSAPFFENCTWAHITTSDFLHYQYHPLAIYPQKGEGIWSGSAVYDAFNTTGLFDENGGFVAIYTRFQIDNSHQRQEIGISTNGIYYERYAGNPVIPNTENIWAFRDPKVFWYEPDKKWVAIVAGGIVRFYSSPDLIHWKFESENSDIETECPDIFPLKLDQNAEEKKWVLSLCGRYYYVGDFDGHTFTPLTGKIPMNAGKDFYALQTFDNIPEADGRRIAITWMDCWDNVNRPYQSLTLPVSLTLNTNKNGEMRLFQNPIRELKQLRNSYYAQNNISVLPGTDSVFPMKSDCCEIIVDAICDCTDFQLHVLKTGEESTIIGYRPAASEIYTDRGSSGILEYTAKSPAIQSCPILPCETIHLHLFVDCGSVEIFVNGGEQAISVLTYPIGDAGEIVCRVKDGEVRIKNMEVYTLNAVSIQKAEFNLV